MKKTLRFGQSVPVDEVFEAWTSSDVPRMRAATQIDSNGVDRYHLLQSLVRELYKLRSEPARREEMFGFGALFLAELPALMAELARHDVMQRRSFQADENRRAERDGRPAKQFDESPKTYYIEVFMLLIRAYCEDERYDDARNVARRAFEVGYATDDHLTYLLEGIEKRRRRREKAARQKAGS